VKAVLKLGMCVGLLAAITAACSNNPPPRAVETAAAEPAATAETRSASDSIAEARCAREDRCNNVGDDRTYSSTQDCLARVRADWKDDLNAVDCPGGVNDAQLSECLTAVREEECSSPLDTLSRVAECTAAQICID
jgi:hypothetical protein